MIIIILMLLMLNSCSTTNIRVDKVDETYISHSTIITEVKHLTKKLIFSNVLKPM